MRWQELRGRKRWDLGRIVGLFFYQIQRWNHLSFVGNGEREREGGERKREERVKVFMRERERCYENM